MVRVMRRKRNRVKYRRGKREEVGKWWRNEEKWEKGRKKKDVEE